jgi:hypothetical protein
MKESSYDVDQICLNETGGFPALKSAAATDGRRLKWTVVPLIRAYSYGRSSPLIPSRVDWELSTPPIS